MDNEELQTRRQFFKNATQRMLPMIGAIVAAPTILTTTLSSCACDECEGTCMDGCIGTCSGSCDSTCKDTCEGSATGKPTTGTIDGHEYVDLGLSVLWATCNIGANNPEDAGDDLRFVFSDCDYTEEQFFRNFLDLKINALDEISGTYLDTARKRWGEKWRMPTKNEIEELVKNCSPEKFSNGVKIISKVNGNSIFIPFRKNQNWSELWSGSIYDDTIDKDFRSISAHILHVYAWPEAEIRRTIDFVTIFIQSKYESANIKIRPVAEKESSMQNCNGSCTAYCSSDCTGTCKNKCHETCKSGCGNGCIGGCKVNCSTGCKTECTQSCGDSCYSNCTGKCTATCADSCKAQTSQTCSSCANNCSSKCTQTCASECKGQSSQGCSNCATQCSGECDNTCSYGCARQCKTSCGGACKGKCGNSCQVECIGIAKLTYCASCGRSCTSSCNESCTFDCYSTCKSVGYK